MIDTHCHLYLKEFDKDLNEMMQRALEAGVKKFFLPAIDSNCTQRMDILELKYPGICFSMAGLHPCSVKENFLEEIDTVNFRLIQKKIVAIGEAGLDFFWDKTFMDQQYTALHMQIELALQYKLPLILHTRNATQETINVVREYSGRGLRGIFHCFGGTKYEADQIADAGFLMGIGGVVTYKNAGLAEVLENIDVKYLVLETDAPYLSPVPVRGKRNESSFLKYIAEKIALIKKMPVADIETITSVNAENLFGV